MQIIVHQMFNITKCSRTLSRTTTLTSARGQGDVK